MVSAVDVYCKAMSRIAFLISSGRLGHATAMKENSSLRCSPELSGSAKGPKTDTFAKSISPKLLLGKGVTDSSDLSSEPRVGGSSPSGCNKRRLYGVFFYALI